MGLGFRLVKIADISYITLVYFILGFVSARMLDTIFGKFDEKMAKKTSKISVILSAILKISINSALIYIIRNIVPPILPSPLEGIYGFKQNLVKELTGAPTYAFALLYYQKNFQSELKYIYNLFE